MDLNDIRAAFTLLSFVLFMALAWHTWNRRRAAEHAAAAQLIFQGEVPTEHSEAARPNAEAHHG